MKKISYYVILTAAALLLTGSLLFTGQPGFPLPDNEEIVDEPPVETGLLLLVILPLEERSSEFSHLYDRLDWFEDSFWLPADFVQGSPPGNLNKLVLPAALYEARELIPGDLPYSLTFDIEDTDPAYTGSSELTAFHREENGGYYYLWLPIEDYQTDLQQARFILDAGAALAGFDLPVLSGGGGYIDSSFDSDESTFELIIFKIARQEQDFNPAVGLYTGKNAWNINVQALKNFFNHYQIEWSEFDEQDAVGMDLAEKFDLICFPGGSATKFHNAILDHTNIRQYVEGGGRYLGICAGAYYASDVMVWDGDYVDFPLALFPGRGIWPLPERANWGQKTAIRLDQSHPVNQDLDLPSEKLEMCYFNGPYFSPYDEAENVEIIAWYDQSDQPAAVVSTVGQGKAMLLSMHPELGYHSRQFNTYGQAGAQWEWLYAVIKWLAE